MQNKTELVHFRRSDTLSGDYRVIYEDKDKVTIEYRYSELPRKYIFPVILPWVAIEIIACILLFIFCDKEEPSESCRIFTVLTLTIPLTIVLLMFVLGSIKNAIRKIIIDRYTVVVTEEKNGKMTSKEQYSLSSVKDIEVSTGDYGMMYIYLNLADKSIRVLSGNLERTNDHRGKLELARRMSGLLGVPVIEKT